MQCQSEIPAELWRLQSAGAMQQLLFLLRSAELFARTAFQAALFQKPEVVRNEQDKGKSQNQRTLHLICLTRAHLNELPDQSTEEISDSPPPSLGGSP